ncbi:MAG: metal-dependent transcriptional regulator [Actinomycetales bacterium]
MAHDLIDTTEMYLRTIYELQEEGVVPLRARIAERLGQSGPTVSQTVARMERDGLLILGDDRHLELTDEGHRLATRVMRKHRLAERLLVDVIGLEWEQVHEEACRWEHVISDAVERKLVALLEHPTESPYGNPIPGLDELADDSPNAAATADPAASARPAHPGQVNGEHRGVLDGVRALTDVDLTDSSTVVVRRLGEPIQTDIALLGRLRRAGVAPGAAVQVIASSSPGGVLLGSAGEQTEVSREIASHVFVAAV